MDGWIDGLMDSGARVCTHSYRIQYTYVCINDSVHMYSVCTPRQDVLTRDKRSEPNFSLLQKPITDIIKPWSTFLDRKTGGLTAISFYLSLVSLKDAVPPRSWPCSLRRLRKWAQSQASIKAFFPVHARECVNMCSCSCLCLL